MLLYIEWGKVFESMLPTDGYIQTKNRCSKCSFSPVKWSYPARLVDFLYINTNKIYNITKCHFSRKSINTINNILMTDSQSFGGIKY